MRFIIQITHFFLFRRKHYPQAEAMLQKALEIFPDQPTFLKNLAQLYSEQENFTSAIAVYRQLTKRLPLKLENFITLAKLYLRLDYFQEALNVLERASKINATDPQIQTLSAEIKQKRHKKA